MTQLIPGLSDADRAYSIAEIDDLIAKSTNPRFASEAIALRDAFRDGDVVEEFCTSKQSWNEGMGVAGYRIKRNGELVRMLVIRMN
tara:strand:- start:726 stop:983 length:258 start_codon:yes stop_codon:yes gene_type:complete